MDRSAQQGGPVSRRPYLPTLALGSRYLISPQMQPRVDSVVGDLPGLRVPRGLPDSSSDRAG